MHKWWKKRLKKIFEDIDFYAACATYLVLFSLIGQIVFTYGMEYHWIIAELISVGVYMLFLGAATSGEIFSSSSLYDKQIIEDEREKEEKEVLSNQQKAEEKMKHLNRLRELIASNELANEHQDIIELLKKSKVLS